jgi:hypothetical protein
MAFPAVYSLFPNPRLKLRQRRCDSLYLGRPVWMIFMQIAQLMGFGGSRGNAGFSNSA